ncbi:DUF5063 domain-containing protein [Leptospira congkakensis]|nr:DUF5063 domain-containing protein [Leptospira congkakensis]
MNAKLLINLKEFVKWSDHILSENDKADILMGQLLRIHSLYYETDYNLDNSVYPDPPNLDYWEVRKKIEMNFPEFKAYNTVYDVTIESQENKIIQVDPYDDLTDLVKDFKEIVWFFENTSSDNALWHFKSGYMHHWGQHISNLTYFLFHLKYRL